MAVPTSSRSTTAPARLLAVDRPDQNVSGPGPLSVDLKVLRVGTVDQTLLQPAGDDTRIDWGHAYVAAPAAQATGGDRLECVARRAISSRRRAFTSGTTSACRARPTINHPAWRSRFMLGEVGPKPVSRHLMIAYDEIYAQKFLGRKLRPYWRRDGATAWDLLGRPSTITRISCGVAEAFDAELMADLTRAGGLRYAEMAALAYRQALAGCGLAADANKQPLLFAKENSSNGCVATVDVIYPAAPQFLLMGPSYAKALVAPALVYSTSPRWKFPFAPHDVGTYPQANGQVYGGGENSTNEADMMPVEESANMILLCAAIAQDGGPRRVLRSMVAAAHALGGLPREVRRGSRKPALHRRLHGPSGPQRQPVRQGDSGDRGLRRTLSHAGRRRGRGQVQEHCERIRPALDESRRRRRSLPHRV